MKKFKAIWLLLLFLIPTLCLTGCESVTTRANHQDTWSRIERRKKVIVGLDDSFVPMGNWSVMTSTWPGPSSSSTGSRLTSNQLIGR